MPVVSQPNVTSNAGPNSVDDVQAPSVPAEGGSVTRGVAVFASSGTIDERLMRYINEKLPSVVAKANRRTGNFYPGDDVEQEVLVNMLQWHESFGRVSDREHLILTLYRSTVRRIRDLQRKTFALKRGKNRTESLDALDVTPCGHRELLPDEKAIANEDLARLFSFLDDQDEEVQYVLACAFFEEMNAEQIARESEWPTARADKYRRWIRAARTKLQTIIDQ